MTTPTRRLRVWNRAGENGAPEVDVVLKNLGLTVLHRGEDYPRRHMGPRPYTEYAVPERHLGRAVEIVKSWGNEYMLPREASAEALNLLSRRKAP